MPQFVQSTASQQLPTPFHFPNVEAWVFLFEIPMGAVKRYCDSHLNLGSSRDRKFTYRPLAIYPYATLMVLRYPTMISGDHATGNGVPFAQRGYMTQNEVFISVPLVRHGTTMANFLLDVAVESAMPFIVVDNATSAISGREILGFQKVKAEINLGTGPYPSGLSADVKMLGWPSLNPDSMQQLLPFMSISTGPQVPGVGNSPEVTSAWTLLGTTSARKAMEGLAAASDGLDMIACGLMPSALQMVALKQFRDAKNPRKAIYQAITGAKPRYYNVHNIQYYNENDVKITFHDGGSFSEIIKMFLDPPLHNSEWNEDFIDVSVPAKLAYSFTTDIDYADQRTLHTFVSDVDPPQTGSPAPVGDMISPWLRPWRGFWSGV
jgi:hypothetical protein